MKIVILKKCEGKAVRVRTSVCERQTKTLTAACFIEGVQLSDLQAPKHDRSPFLQQRTPPSAQQDPEE